MITSAEEFKRLRLSYNLEEQRRAASDSADVDTWLDVIKKFPELKEWIVQNKSIQTEILELLAKDPDSKVRSWVARKRKITSKIFELLKNDNDETVRHALLCNTKLPIEKKLLVKVDDSEWLSRELDAIYTRNRNDEK